MDMNSLAVWLAGCVLVTLGVVVIMAGAIVINNLIHRFWKPVTFFYTQQGLFPTVRFVTQEELIQIEQEKEKKNV